MKLEEKIELLTAYAKDKKLVEVYDENTDSWMIKVFDIWDFENGKYRIKSKIESKFKAGDVLVHRDLIGEPLSERNLLTVSSIDIPSKQYVFIDGSTKDISEVDEEYIEAFSENTLWYFEFKLKDVGWITPADNKRMTFTDASFTSLISLNYSDLKDKAVLDRRILFSLGFQLKE